MRKIIRRKKNYRLGKKGLFYNKQMGLIFKKYIFRVAENPIKSEHPIGKRTSVLSGDRSTFDIFLRNVF